MSQTIGGVGFAIARGQGGQTSLSVVSKSKDSSAVEFIVESSDGAWASEVLAARSGVWINIPPTSGSLRVRLFNGIGKEIYRESDNILDVVSDAVHPGSSPATQSNGKLKGVILFVATICGGYFFFGSSLFTKSVTPSATPSALGPSLAVLSRSANLRSAPLLAKDNVIATLPFGTQLSGMSESGNFMAVQVFGGAKGFIHKDVVGDANRVRVLGLKDSLQQAQAISDDRLMSILRAVQAAPTSLLSSSLLERSDWGKVEAVFQSAVLQTSGDDVAGRFFHYLAEDAAARRNFADAVVYFRAAALSNPASVSDVHGWGVTQLRLVGSVDETAAMHAVVVAPRSANTWLMVASHIAGLPTGTGPTEVVAALRLAVSFSSNRSVTKRFFQDLSRATSNAVLKSALLEVADSI